MMDNIITGQWWLPHRSTLLPQMRTGKHMKIKTTINQEEAQQARTTVHRSTATETAKG